MKRCSYCGAEYTDDLIGCPIDQHSLEPSNEPALPIKKPKHFFTMNLLRMFGWEALLIVGAAVLLTFGIHLANSQNSPEPVEFFLAVVGVVTVLIAVVPWLDDKKTNRTAIAVMIVAMVFIWWWIAMILWVNTYGE